jgi:hypothetical protein
MSSPKTYTANDIARYHSGEMTAAEMHSLEKAALDDPMLADALEGYKMTTTAPEDLQQLQQRLQKRVENKESKKVFFMGASWLKIAASVVLIAGAGWLVVQTFSGNNNELASAEADSVEQLSPSSVTDSVQATTAVPPAVLSYDTAKQSSGTAAVGSASSAKPLQTGPTVTTPVTATKNADAKKEETIADRIESAETAAREAMALKDNVAANTRRIAADTVRQNDMVLQQQNRRVSREEKTATAPAAARAPMENAPTAEPEGGWPAFEKYLSEKRNTAGDQRKKTNQSREVELQFEVDPSGRPVNIRVLQSNCSTCNDEAIRLLKEGPSWKGKTGRLKISLYP